MVFQKRRNIMKRKQPWQSAARDLYQEVTDKIIAALEEGTLPWRHGWNQAVCGGPMNPTTGRAYRGINILLLGMRQVVRVNDDPRWCSYRQAQERGWQVREGERGTTIVFYRKLQKRSNTILGDNNDADSSSGEHRSCFVLRASAVFHASQIEGMPLYVPPLPEATPWISPEAINIIVANSGALIRYGGAQAFFRPSSDHIQMPPRESFEDAGHFAQTILHELGHWVCGKPRLDLSGNARFGSEAYALEELVVDMAAQNVCAVLGIDAHLNNSASYVASWLKALKNDKRAIFRAASDAQRVADHILGFHPAYAALAGKDDIATASDPVIDRPLDDADESESLVKAA
jgi:antirestriction protein ArdC